MSEITIKTAYGDKVIEAKIKGQLAYHPCDGRPSLMTITHIKSGRSIFHTKKRDLKQALKELAEFDFDGYFDAGCPTGYFAPEQRSNLMLIYSRYAAY